MLNSILKISVEDICCDTQCACGRSGHKVVLKGRISNKQHCRSIYIIVRMGRDKVHTHTMCCPATEGPTTYRKCPQR